MITNSICERANRSISSKMVEGRQTGGIVQRSTQLTLRDITWLFLDVGYVIMDETATHEQYLLAIRQALLCRGIATSLKRVRGTWQQSTSKRCK